MTLESGLEELIDSVPPWTFEHLIGVLWELHGWRVALTSQGSDEGIDLRASRGGLVSHLAYIQVKQIKESRRLSAPAIREYAGLYQRSPDPDSVVLVTTGEFTDPARREATDLDVTLIGRKELLRRLQALTLRGVSVVGLRQAVALAMDESRYRSTRVSAIRPPPRSVTSHPRETRMEDELRKGLDRSNELIQLLDLLTHIERDRGVSDRKMLKIQLSPVVGKYGVECPQVVWASEGLCLASGLSRGGCENLQYLFRASDVVEAAGVTRSGIGIRGRRTSYRRWRWFLGRLLAVYLDVSVRDVVRVHAIDSSGTVVLAFEGGGWE